MRMVMIRGHERLRSLRWGGWWYFLAGGTLGVAWGEMMEMERRGEDTGSIWTITKPGGEDALHKNSS